MTIAPIYTAQKLFVNGEGHHGSGARQEITRGINTKSKELNLMEVARTLADVDGVLGGNQQTTDATLHRLTAASSK